VYWSNPQQPQVAVSVDLLDVDRDRLLHQRLRGRVLAVGVAHPEVFPALLGDAGDVADRDVRTGCAAERDLSVAAAAARAGRAEEQHLAGGKALERAAVYLPRKPG